MRRVMIEEDLVECVISLGPNLFYNSSMTSCLLVTNNNKQAARKGKVLFIQGIDLVRQEKTMSYLDEDHINQFLNIYESFSDKKGLSKVETNDHILKDDNARLSVQLFVSSNEEIKVDFEDAYDRWNQANIDLEQSMSSLFTSLNHN
jgi:type I restriction enzyme M protein